MYRIALPQTPIGNYWITDENGDNERKLVNIEGKDGKWQIVSNNHAKFVNSSCVKIYKDDIIIDKSKEKFIDRVILNEYNMHIICVGDSEDLFVLYCSPVYGEKYLHVDIENKTEFLIGRGPNNHISYNNVLVENTHARVFFNDKSWMIENFDKKFGTFVNNRVVTTNRKLSNGDIIFIMGLKIIIIGDSLFINDPLGKVVCKNQKFVLHKEENYEIDTELEESDDAIEIYSEDDYFSRAPRITNLIECEKVKIDAPPAIQSKEEMPLILTLGSMLSMGAVMMVSMVSSIDGLASGTASAKETTFSLITALAMLLSMILFPILTQKYEKKQKIKYEEKRQKRYKNYINSKIKNIDKIMNKQRNILVENYVSAEKCAEIVLNRTSRLWERKIEEHDFLSIRLGIGDVPLNIDIQYPEEQFVMEDDNLVEILSSVGNKSKILKDAPIAISLVEKNVSAVIVKDNKKIEKFIKNLILQLITFQSYDDLKLVFLLKEDKQKKWEYVKMLPHIWNNTKQIRFFADDYNDMKEISKYLEEDLQNRLQYEENIDYKSFMPYYLIITDDYKRIENLKIITEILKTRINIGFSILCITNNMMQLPNECKTFINLEDEEGMVFESEISSNNQKRFIIDSYKEIDFEQISKKLSNIPIKYTGGKGTFLPSSFSFLEMYDVGRIEQLNVLERWKRNDSTLSLQAPLGIDNVGMPIMLDIHEKFHGPHGLIAGSTGSGKSEFIITYILSLAINYHPDDVTFVLIDYKGGGLAGAFQKRGTKLPHLVGTITNIDTVGLQRSLASIQSELRRRQVAFNEARNLTDESTIDIYKYQKLYHEGIVKKPIPHLLIICDEFAELKQQQEEFMDELISVARIGRSLGVHLILATQKPAGIVNDQIRSNSKFAICLKVQDREDSNDVIRKPDAASLKQAGQFYMQVGNDEYFVLGQSAWAGAPYFPSDVTKKKVDNSIEFISNIGAIIKKADNSQQKVVKSQGDQLTTIVKYLYELAEANNIKANSLWLENIPETIFINQVTEKYHFKTEKNKINPVIGEYDDPFNQKQSIVNLDLSSGNTIIYGNAESGKETLLSTIVYDTMTTHSTEEAQFYLLDFGTEALKIFTKSPHVGSVVFMSEDEKISRLFDMLQKEIKERKAILSEYNGDYNLYLNTSGEEMPMIVVIINNYEAFSEIYEDEYEETFQTLTREGVKCGINFIITASTYNDIRYRLSQNFKQKIALQLNNEDDYLSIFDGIGKKRPSHLFGRGMISLDGEVYEFQTAKICEPEKWNLHIKEVIEGLNITNPKHAKPIPVIPDKLTFEDVKEDLKDLSSVPLGITRKELKIISYNFKKNFINIIASRNIEDAGQFIIHLLEEMKQLENVDIKVFDAERLVSNKKVDIKSEYITFISNLEHNNEKNILCIIIGVDKFVNDFDNMDNNFDETFYSTLRKAEENEKCNYILVDNANKLKNSEYDEWYKSYVSNENGIWVGNGVEDQYLISLNTSGKEIINNCGDSFGYVISQEKPTLIKLLGMKEKGDDNE